MKYIANIVGWISFPIYLFGLLFAVFWYSGEGNDLAAVFVVLCALPASGLSFLGAMGTYALCSWLVESYGKYAKAAIYAFTSCGEEFGRAI